MVGRHDGAGRDGAVQEQVLHHRLLRHDALTHDTIEQHQPGRQAGRACTGRRRSSTGPGRRQAERGALRHLSAIRQEAGRQTPPRDRRPTSRRGGGGGARDTTHLVVVHSWLAACLPACLIDVDGRSSSASSLISSCCRLLGWPSPSTPPPPRPSLCRPAGQRSVVSQLVGVEVPDTDAAVLPDRHRLTTGRHAGRQGGREAVKRERMTDSPSEPPACALPACALPVSRRGSRPRS